MKFQIKVAVSKNGNTYKVIGVKTASGFKSIGFLNDYMGSMLLNISAREYSELPVGVYDIE